MRYFSRFETLLWSFSVITIIVAFMIFDEQSLEYLAVSIIGVTALIFLAKGNPIGQALIVVFSLFYGIIAFNNRYYGELITYVGMTLPMATMALITWLKHPFNGKISEVRISTLQVKTYGYTLMASLGVTIIFYFVLRVFDTNQLILSTLSIATSFYAATLTLLRSRFYALAYVGNDLVLISLWSIASFHNPAYIVFVICFIVFLVNDLYGFVNWSRMLKKQSVV